jgi:hypothetical protein
LREICGLFTEIGSLLTQIGGSLTEIGDFLTEIGGFLTGWQNLREKGASWYSTPSCPGQAPFCWFIFRHFSGNILCLI